MNHRIRSRLTIMILCQLVLVSCGSSDSDDSAIPTLDVITVTIESLSPEAYLLANLRCDDLICWLGIIPGITTFAEAQSILEEYYGTDNVNAQTGYIEWDDLMPLYGSLRIDNQDVVEIMRLGFRDDQFTVSEWVSWFGEPSLVNVARAFSSNAYCAGAFVRYPAIGINAGLVPTEELRNDFVGINPDQYISGLTIMSPILAADWTITDHWVVDWQGYIDYCDYIVTTEM